MALDVLIVDHDPQAIIRNFKVIFPVEYADFHPAYRGEQAIEIVNERDFDLISLSYNLPDMKGYEAAQLLRKERKNLRIIGLSFEHEWKESEAKKAGLEAYGSASFLVNYISQMINPKI